MPPSLPIYHGKSMTGVFTDGDRLVMIPVGFADLRVGDVVAVMTPEKQIVHRLIRRNGDEAVTMGDNNSSPDAAPLNSKCRFLLVTDAISPRGRRRTVAGGAAGMKLFHRNRRRRRCRALFGTVWRRLEFLAFWRIPVRNAIRCGAETHYWFRNRPIARRTADGRLVYAAPFEKLLFRIAVDSPGKCAEK